MSIFHLADTHLGYRQFSGKLDPERGLNQRECDVYRAWHAAIDLAIELQPDVVVHAGDLFDSSRPSPRALAEALDGFGKLREAGLQAVVIAGNHETPRFRSSGSVFEILERFGVHAVWSGPRTIRVNGLAIHAIPHEPSAEQLVENIRILRADPKAEANVLLLHAGLEAVRQSYGEVNEIELDPEVLAQADYDYIAMGHLHRYQAPQVNAIYPGSLERLDFADVEGDKAVLEVDIAAGAGARSFVHRHPLDVRSMFDFVVRCENLGPSEVLVTAREAVVGKALDDAVVRMRLEGIGRDVYQALDFETLDQLFDACLHHVLQVGRTGLVATEDTSQREISFDAFARSRMPANVDPEAIIALAKRFLDDAAIEEAERQAS